MHLNVGGGYGAPTPPPPSGYGAPTGRPSYNGGISTPRPSYAAGNLIAPQGPLRSPTSNNPQLSLIQISNPQPSLSSTFLPSQQAQTFPINNNFGGGSQVRHLQQECIREYPILHTF